MPAVELLLNEKVFLNRSLYQEAERLYSLRKHALDTAVEAKQEIDEHAKKCKKDDSIKVADLVDRLNKVEQENAQLKSLLATLEGRLAKMEVSGGKPAAAPAPAKPAPAPATKPAEKKAEEEEEDDDFDVFGEEDAAEKQKITEERLKAYNEKKAKKPVLVAKSSVLLDVKVWDDETDMKKLEESVRSIVMEGLVWGSSKLVPVAFGVKKLQIQCVIEDDKVSTESLEEQICAFDDFVQSVDIASFNKI